MKTVLVLFTLSILIKAQQPGQLEPNPIIGAQPAAFPYPDQQPQLQPPVYQPPQLGQGTQEPIIGQQPTQQCVLCRPLIGCNCPAGYQCVYVERTCNTCSRYLCYPLNIQPQPQQPYPGQLPSPYSNNQQRPYYGQQQERGAGFRGYYPQNNPSRFLDGPSGNSPVNAEMNSGLTDGPGPVIGGGQGFWQLYDTGSFSEHENL